MATNAHFAQRLSLAQGALDAVKRSPPGKGLPPYLCHRLASSLIALILLHGSDLFTTILKMPDKLDTFWRRVQRWVTNCFSFTPIPVLAIEACLPPLLLLIEYRQRMAALRLTSAPPEINPAAARLHRSVSNKSTFRSPQCHRSLLVKHNPAKCPLMWKAPQRNLCKHLPIDEISNRVLPLLEGRPSLPLLNPHLFPTLTIPPPDPPPRLLHSSKERIQVHFPSPGVHSGPTTPRLPLRPLPITSPFHGPLQIPGGPHPLEEIRQELPSRSPLLVQS